METENGYLYVFSRDSDDTILLETNKSNESDKRLKNNIKDSKVKALDIIKSLKHREFNWKETGKKQNIGYVAQELEKIDENYIYKMPKLDKEGKIIDEIYNVNILPILSTATKAIQEQQFLIDKMKKDIEDNNKIIKELWKRLEKLEEKYNGC